MESPDDRLEIVLRSEQTQSWVSFHHFRRLAADVVPHGDLPKHGDEMIENCEPVF
jgi:hypothetical protein